MNPITNTAIKLEKEAHSLYNALQNHTRLYARRSLSDAAYARYERRTRLTDQVRRLERMAAR
jgi:hypothetical protein